MKCTPATVEAAVFSNGKRTIVIAVNTAKQAVKTTINGIPGNNLTELYADGAQVAVRNNSSIFEIPAETTRIFEVK